jgi:integrase/recombinase XerD
VAQLRIPDILLPEEQSALIQQPNPRYRTGLRNLCLLRVGLDAGLRAAELCNLKVSDLDMRTGRLIVRQGKGKKDRILWLREQTLELLSQWRQRSPVADPAGPLFCTLQGNALSTVYLRTMVARYAARAGIQKRVHPHMLRHTFATDLYRQTKNIRLVQKALGHASLQVTQIYTHIVDEELEAAMKSFRETGQ